MIWVCVSKSTLLMLDGACTSYERSLSLEPGNQVALSELNSVLQELDSKTNPRSGDVSSSGEKDSNTHSAANLGSVISVLRCKTCGDKLEKKNRFVCLDCQSSFCGACKDDSTYCHDPSHLMFYISRATPTVVH